MIKKLLVTGLAGLFLAGAVGGCKSTTLSSASRYTNAASRIVPIAIREGIGYAKDEGLLTEEEGVVGYDSADTVEQGLIDASKILNLAAKRLAAKEVEVVKPAVPMPATSIP